MDRAAAPKSVDEYIGRVESEAARSSLEALRATIRKVAPQATESISYGIPTYKVHRFLAGFGAFKKHCSFFPGHTVRDFTEELKGYKTSKGTIQFPHGHILPESLVRAILEARMADNEVP